MAHLEDRWVCPVCKRYSYEQSEARRCAASHVKSELWAVGKHKSVRVFENHAPDSFHGVRGALREADRSDIIEERRAEERRYQLSVVKGENNGTAQV